MSDPEKDQPALSPYDSDSESPAPETERFSLAEDAEYRAPLFGGESTPSASSPRHARSPRSAVSPPTSPPADLSPAEASDDATQVFANRDNTQWSVRETGDAPGSSSSPATVEVPTSAPPPTTRSPLEGADPTVPIAVSPTRAASGTAAGTPANTAVSPPVADAAVTDTAVRRTSLLRPEESAPVVERREEPPLTAYAPDDELFAGATYDKVPSRAGAHWWSLLATLFLTPIAWYLLSDAGARLTLPAGAPWTTGVLNFAAIGELLAGLVVLAVLLSSLKGSSLGAWVTGTILTLIGAAFVFIPSLVQQFLEPYLEALRAYNAFGGNVAHHLIADGSTGRFLIAGITLFAIGYVSVGARRLGKHEQRIRESIGRRQAAHDAARIPSPVD